MNSSPPSAARARILTASARGSVRAKTFPRRCSRSASAKSQDSIDHCLKLYQLYGNAARKLRAMGSAALDLAYVATGRLDAYIEQGVNLWDIAAGIVLQVEGSEGGVVELEQKVKGKYPRVCAHSGRIEYPLK